MKLDKKYDENIEFFIEGLENILEDLGFSHVRLSEHKSVCTSSYDTIITEYKGKEYAITFNESCRFNKDYMKWECTHYIDDILKNEIK